MVRARVNFNIRDFYQAKSSAAKFNSRKMLVCFAFVITLSTTFKLQNKTTNLYKCIL